MDSNSLVSIIIAVVSSSALTALINYISNHSKIKAEAKKIEQEVVSDKIDQASTIVETAMKLLEDVQAERDKLAQDKKSLEEINGVLSREIENLRLNIINLKNRLEE